jgi:hypothetical protein
MIGLNYDWSLITDQVEVHTQRFYAFLRVAELSTEKTVFFDWWIWNQLDV